jgi:hypothetical protein
MPACALTILTHYTIIVCRPALQLRGGLLPRPARRRRRVGGHHGDGRALDRLHGGGGAGAAHRAGNGRAPPPPPQPLPRPGERHSNCTITHSNCTITPSTASWSCARTRARGRRGRPPPCRAGTSRPGRGSARLPAGGGRRGGGGGGVAGQGAGQRAGRPDDFVMVCTCESITKGEILDALRSPTRPRTLDGLKRRTRAMTGRCQVTLTVL